MKTPPMLNMRLPILGHTLAFSKDPGALFRRGYAELGPVFAIDLMGQKIAVVTGPEHNKKVYLSTDQALNISRSYAALKAAFGEVLFIAGPEAYNNQRPILKALFSRERMVGYLEAMNDEVQAWLDGFAARDETDITEDMLHLTQFVAGQAFVGRTFRDELDPAFWEDYAALGRSIDMLLPPNLPLPKFIRRDRAKRRMRAVLADVIARRRADPERYDDAITLILETPQRDGTTMSDEDIASLLLGLMFAGHETTAGQAAWTLIALSEHPEVLARVQAEVEEHVGDDLQLTAATLRKLEFLYMVIDETTRLYPSAEMQARVVEEEITFGEYTVPAGWNVFVNAANSHHLDSEFTDPERFDPARFERGEGKSPWHSVGFGGGVHKCTGMNFAKNEMAIIVARLLKQFEIERLTPETHVVRGLGASRPSSTRFRLTRRAR